MSNDEGDGNGLLELVMFFIAVGDHVNVDETVAEVETDKVRLSSFCVWNVSKLGVCCL